MMIKHYLIRTTNIKGEEYNIIVDEHRKDRYKNIIKEIEVSGDKARKYNEATNLINRAASDGRHDLLAWQDSQKILNEIVEDNNF